MSITVDDIEAVRRVLAELPRHQPKEVSKQEAIALLGTELGAAQRRGYNPEDLAKLLSDGGIAINAATLRGYLRRTRKSRRSKGAPKEPAASTEATAAPSSRSAPAQEPAIEPATIAMRSGAPVSMAPGLNAGGAGKTPEVRSPKSLQPT